MATVAEQLEAAAFERQIQIDRLTAHQVRDFSARLAKLVAHLVAELRKADLSGRRHAARRLQGFDALVRRLRPDVAATYRPLLAHNVQLAVDVAEDEGADLQATVAALVGAGLFWRTLTRRRAEKIVEDMHIMGAPLAEWWAKQRADLVRDFRNELRAGLLAGEDVATLVQRVQGTELQRRLGRGGLAGVAQRHIKTLVQTAVHAARQEARMSIYAAHPEVVQGVQALNESPVSRICQARAGRVWALDDPARPAPPPWHPNCKTTLIPVFKAFNALERQRIPPPLWSRLQRLAQAKRVALNGQPAPGLTPEQLFKKMPRTQAAKLLGRNRLQMFDDGILDFRQLVDQTGRPRTLPELKGLQDNG